MEEERAPKATAAREATGALGHGRPHCISYGQKSMVPAGGGTWRRGWRCRVAAGSDSSPRLGPREKNDIVKLFEKQMENC